MTCPLHFPSSWEFVSGSLKKVDGVTSHGNVGRGMSSFLRTTETGVE